MEILLWVEFVYVKMYFNITGVFVLKLFKMEQIKLCDSGFHECKPCEIYRIMRDMYEEAFSRERYLQMGKIVWSSEFCSR